MRLRWGPSETATRRGLEFAAHLTCDHACSSYGRPVLIETATREPISVFSACLAELVEATAEERAELAAAGYRVRPAESVGSPCESDTE